MGSTMGGLENLRIVCGLVEDLVILTVPILQRVSAEYFYDK
jgi:hypothetical protein